MKSSNIYQTLKTKGHATDGTAPALPGVGSPLKLGKKPSKKEKTLDVQRKKDIELAATKTQLMVAKNPISPPEADAKLEVKRSKLPSLEVNSSVQSKLDWAAGKRKAKAKAAKQPAKRKPKSKYDGATPGLPATKAQPQILGKAPRKIAQRVFF